MNSAERPRTGPVQLRLPKPRGTTSLSSLSSVPCAYSCSLSESLEYLPSRPDRSDTSIGPDEDPFQTREFNKWIHGLADSEFFFGRFTQVRAARPATPRGNIDGQMTSSDLRPDKDRTGWPRPLWQRMRFFCRDLRLQHGLARPELGSVERAKGDIKAEYLLLQSLPP